MVGGFNHNFRYLGEIYHIQTEDSGAKNSRIVTLLFRGGTVLASEKNSYSELIGREGLAGLVEDRMKEQHKEMIRRLKDGYFDGVIQRLFPATVSDVADSDGEIRLGAEITSPLKPEELDASDKESFSETSSMPTVEELEKLVFAYLTIADSRYDVH